jgi:hypothetical protein
VVWLYTFDYIARPGSILTLGVGGTGKHCGLRVSRVDTLNCIFHSLDARGVKDKETWTMNNILSGNAQIDSLVNYIVDSHKRSLTTP